MNITLLPDTDRLREMCCEKPTLHLRVDTVLSPAQSLRRMRDDHSRFEILHKWAFGMSPPRAATQQRRSRAARAVADFLRGSEQTNDLAADLSEIKGLFSRVARQDQWDWFTVSGQLGYPSAHMSQVIAKTLGELRRDLPRTPTVLQSEPGLRLRRLPVRRCLSVFLGEAQIENEAGAGWIYYLSTRNARDVAKIGVTTRTVEERVREINGATGVVEPFGVRACWRVRDPRRAEALVHATLGNNRIRADREFFRVEFMTARREITKVLASAQLEIRTLDALTALGGEIENWR